MSRGYIEAKFAGWRDTALMEFGELGAEGLWVGELGRHVFELL